MHEVIVNRLTFDFTCRTERAARAISKEIVHYKASSINSIISEILSKKTDPDLLWKIGRLEIDLGNIRLEDIETDYILLQFKEQLARSIEETRSYVQKESLSSISVVSPEDDRLILLKTLLLTGDLPWWVDKNTFTGIDSVIRVILRQRKEELKEFLDGHRNNPDLVIRIKSLSSKETVSLLNELVPGIADLSSIQFFDNGRKKAIPDIVFEPELEQSPLESVKLVLIGRILNEAGQSLLSGLAKLGILSAPEMARLKTFIDARNRGGKLQVTEILKKLTVFQLGFLSHQVEWKIPDEEDSSPAESQKKMVRWLVGKMEIKNAALESELMRVSLVDLHSLVRIFRSYGRKDSWKSIWIETLMEDHRLFQMKLLSLLVDKTEDDFRIAIRGLTSSRLFTLHQIISSGSVPSPVGTKFIAQILGRLPEKSLSRISQLVRMEKKEVEAVIPVSVVEDSAINTLKTIVENAGLCLLAPYLPAFFDRLGLTENGKFSSKKPAYRAAYLLEYLVHGRQRNYEYTMQFNKLLCGLNIEEPLPGYKRLTPKERKEAEELTESVILNWKTLKSTGMTGFRQSFLKRKGILTEQEGFWVLQVEKKGYDLLLDSIPWTFNRIKFSWMEKMIQIEW